MMKKILIRILTIVLSIAILTSIVLTTVVWAAAPTVKPATSFGQAAVLLSASPKKSDMEDLEKQIKDAFKGFDIFNDLDNSNLKDTTKEPSQKPPVNKNTSPRELSASEAKLLYKYGGAGNTLGIISYLGSESEVIIPDIINGKKVTSIQDNAFTGNTNLKKVVFGSNITDVGMSAFSNCTRLKTLVLNQGICVLDDNAFANTGLVSVDFPDTLQRIGFMCFAGNTKLTTLRFAGNAPQILQKSFGEVLSTSLPQLKTVEIAKTATGFDGGDWASSGLNKFFVTVASNKSDTRNAVTLTAKDIKYTLKGKDLTITAYLANYPDIIIPNVIAGNNVRYIGKGAFSNCGTLRSVKFGANVFQIGESAFENCANLADVQFNYGLQYIQTAAFQNTKIKNLVFPSTVKLINCFAFNNVPTVVSLLFYGNAPQIGGDTFGINWWGDPMPKLKKMDITKNASGFDSKYWQERNLTAMASRMSVVVGIDKTKPELLKTFDFQAGTKSNTLK